MEAMYALSRAREAANPTCEWPLDLQSTASRRPYLLLGAKPSKTELFFEFRRDKFPYHGIQSGGMFWQHAGMEIDTSPLLLFVPCHFYTNVTCFHYDFIMFCRTNLLTLPSASCYFLPVLHRSLSLGKYR